MSHEPFKYNFEANEMVNNALKMFVPFKDCVKYYFFYHFTVKLNLIYSF